MRRDMDLIRKIILTTADGPADAELDSLEGVDEEAFALHVQWLEEAGLVHALISESTGGTYAQVTRLTWAGCDFADAIRSDTLWAKAKTNVLKPTASFTFDVLKDWLKAEISQGFPTIRAAAQ